MAAQKNALYFGDNLKVLSERLPDGSYRFPSESVDLVYLDPPFNSNREYNLIFKDSTGTGAAAQIKTFEDTWHWDTTARDTYDDLTVAGVNEGRISDKVGRTIEALVRSLDRNDLSAYLVMMTPRLVQLHRVLKSTGSVYLHCDPTASHYLKVVMDAIFGAENFRSEVIWRRSNAHNKVTTQFGPIHDTLLFYSKSDVFTFHPGTRPYTKAYIEDRFKHHDLRGRYQLNYLTGPGVRTGQSGEAWRGFNPTKVGRHWAVPASLRDDLPDRGAGMTTEAQLEALLAKELIVFPKKEGGQPMYKQYVGPGVPYQDIWAYQPNTKGVLFNSTEHIDQDVKWLEAEAEKLGYETQKPVGLLERIIRTSTSEGDLVLDPFCGCGTATIAAQKLKRDWIGIDITHLSIAVMRNRLMDSFGLKDVPVLGLPEDIESARMLAAESKDGRYEFQWWALGRIDAKPVGGVQKKGADRGIDGVITFTEHDAVQRILVSVKSGKPGLLHVKELIATLQTESGAIGVLIELDEPTAEMRRAAVEAGQYESQLWGGKYERLQILTIAELLDGKKPNLPKFLPGYQKALRIKGEAAQQAELFVADDVISPE